MTPGEFAAKWRGIMTSERAAAQSDSTTCAASWASPPTPMPTPTAPGTPSRKRGSIAVGGAP